MRRKTAAAAAAGALGLATLGGVGIGSALMTTAVAETTTDSTDSATTEPAVPADPADPADPAGPADPADEATRTAERSDRISEALAGLVEAGTLTQEQADAVADELASSDALRGPGGGPGGPGGLGGPGFGVLGEGLATAAETLGITEDELRTQLEDGTTLGEVADAQGVERATLVDALVTFAQAQVAERVASGDLTQERADEITADLGTRITEGLDHALPQGGPGHGGPGGHGPAAPGSTDGSTDDGDS